MTRYLSYTHLFFAIILLAFVASSIGTMPSIARAQTTDDAAEETTDENTDTVTDADETDTVTDRKRGRDFRNRASSTKARIDALRAQNATRTDAVKDRVSDRRATLTDGARDRAQNLLSNIVTRMTAAIERLRNIADRIESRMQKIEDEHDVDASSALALIDEARDSLLDAEIILDDIGSDVESALDSEDVRTEYQSIRAEVKEAGSLIREAHRLLRESVATLKEILRESDVERPLGQRDGPRDPRPDAEETDETEDDNPSIVE